MPFGVASRVGRGMGVLDRVEIVKGEGAVLGVNEVHPVVTKGNLLHSCAKVHQSMEVLFGVVMGSVDMDVLNGVHVPQVKGFVLRAPFWLEWRF